MTYDKYAVKYPSERFAGGYYYSNFYDTAWICRSVANRGQGQKVVKVRLTVLSAEQPGCYYGWQDNDGKLSMVWYNQTLLAVCFGNQQAMDRRLKEGDGKMVWLAVEEASDTF